MACKVRLILPYYITLHIKQCSSERQTQRKLGRKTVIDSRENVLIIKANFVNRSARRSVR
jgi:hypothetical protein